MNWEAVVAIVEMVGLLAIVASLVYVAIQVRQNSEIINQNSTVARSAIVHETSVSYSRFFELIAENADLASIYRRGINDQALDPDEVTRYSALLEIYFANLEDADHQYQSDLYFDEEDETDLCEFMAPVFRPMLDSSYGTGWWNNTAADTCTPTFYEKIQKIRASWDAERNQGLADD
jgi:hypothetical protein